MYVASVPVTVKEPLIAPSAPVPPNLTSGVRVRVSADPSLFSVKDIPVPATSLPFKYPCVVSFEDIETTPPPFKLPPITSTLLRVIVEIEPPLVTTVASRALFVEKPEVLTEIVPAESHST
jgi:hypothetical protein